MTASRSDDPRGAARRPSDQRPPERRSSERLDPSFVRRLEDDALWHERQNRPVRVRPPAREKRSRLLAIVAFVLIAIVVIVIGVTAGGGDSGSPGGGQSSPFSLLPLPSGPVTTTTAPDTSAAFDLVEGTSPPLTTVPVAELVRR
jgi:hypothetical protein